MQLYVHNILYTNILLKYIKFKKKYLTKNPIRKEMCSKLILEQKVKFTEPGLLFSLCTSYTLCVCVCVLFCVFSSEVSGSATTTTTTITDGTTIEGEQNKGSPVTMSYE